MDVKKFLADFEEMRLKFGLSRQDACKLIKLARPTYYTWLAGTPPRKYVFIAAQKRIAEIMTKAHYE